MLRSLVALVVVAAALGAGRASAAQLGIEAGGGGGIERYALSVQWPWKRRWFTEGEWFLGGHWSAGVGYWSARRDRPGASSLVDVGVGPTFRLQRYQPWFLGTPYVEAGVAPSYISERRIAARDLSTHFQFGTHIGLGLVIRRFAIGYRFQHFSNAGLGRFNPGANFNELYLELRF
jgi:lipid A 3-O-deacylase